MRIIIIFLLAIAISISSYETSEGLKYGTLQKVSHKIFPCSYYVAEFGYEGGRAVSKGDDAVQQNTQSVEITKEAYDTLQSYLGDKVIFDYNEVGVHFCGEGKKLTLIKRK